eukprot:3351751-Lingulodinium_polyedra.AAC.1
MAPERLDCVTASWGSLVTAILSCLAGRGASARASAKKERQSPRAAALSALAVMASASCWRSRARLARIAG